jgi:hypothetical protein
MGGAKPATLMMVNQGEARDVGREHGTEASPSCLGPSREGMGKPDHGAPPVIRVPRGEKGLKKATQLTLTRQNFPSQPSQKCRFAKSIRVSITCSSCRG